MNTTRTKRAVWPLALVSAAFLLGCQEQGSEALVGPDGVVTQEATQAAKGGKQDKPPKGGGGGGGGDDPTEAVTWSMAFARVHYATSFKSTADLNILQSDTDNSLIDGCFGVPGAQSSKPNVFWQDPMPETEDDGDINGCAQVTTTGTKDAGGLTIEPAVLLTNDASLIVVARKGNRFEIQFHIQNVGGAVGIQYRSDKFVITRPDAPFTGVGYTLHVDTIVDIYRLKGHTGGGKDAFVGTIRIDDIVYSD